MHTFLGLLGVAVFIPCVIVLAASVTWAVVRFTPPSTGDDGVKTPGSPSS